MKTDNIRFFPSEKEYKKIVEEKTPNSKKVQGFLRAFWVGDVQRFRACLFWYASDRAWHL